MSKPWENEGGEKGWSPLSSVSSSLPLLRLPALSPLLVKETVRAVGGTFIGIEKTGEATRSTQKERGIATVSI